MKVATNDILWEFTFSFCGLLDDVDGNVIKVSSYIVTRNHRILFWLSCRKSILLKNSRQLKYNKRDTKISRTQYCKFNLAFLFVSISNIFDTFDLMKIVLSVARYVTSDKYICSININILVFL